MEEVIHGLLPAALGRCVQQFMKLLHHRQVQFHQLHTFHIGICGLQGRRFPAAGFIFQKDGYILSVIEEKRHRRVANHIGQSHLFIESIFHRCFHSQMTLETVLVTLLIGQRLPVVPALDFLAAHALQKLRLGPGFHPFCQGMDAQLLGHENDGTHDFPALVILVPLERHIQLQRIEPVRLQYIQRGIAAAEIIQPALIACLPELLDFLLQPPLILLQCRLRDFYMEEIPGHLVLLYQLLHKREGIHHLKIHSRQIHRHRHKRAVISHNKPVQLRHRFHDIAVQPLNQPGLLQHRHKNGRHNHAPHRILPPGQGLHAADLTSERTNHRLIVHLDISFLQSPVETAQHIGPIRQILPHGLVIDRPGPAGIPLDPVRRNLGPVIEKMNTAFTDLHCIGVEYIHPCLQLHRRITGVIPHIPGHRLDSLRHIMMQGQHRKGITIEMGNEGMGKMGGKTLCQEMDELIPRPRTVAGIINLEIGEIEIHRRPAAEDALLHILPGQPGNGRIKRLSVHDLQPLRLSRPVTDTGKTPGLPLLIVLVDPRRPLHRDTAGRRAQLKIKRAAPFLCSAALAKRHIPLSHKPLKRAAPL